MAKWGKCDYKQLEKLAQKVEKMSKTYTTAFLEECAKELAARLLTKVIKKTPTGKKPEFLTKAKKSMKITGVSGKKRSFLTKEGSILQTYWSGYIGGTLRRGWTAQTHKEAETGSKSKQTAQEIIDWANSLKVVKNGNVYQIEVVNPVEYASYVEYGHRQEPGRYVPALGRRLKKSWVDGKFMLTISEKELQSSSPKILEDKLNKYLKEGFCNGI